MKSTAMYQLAFIAAAAVFVSSAPARASESDDKIESSFKNTYVNKTYLKDDNVGIESEDGAVTLSGTVAYEAHKALASDAAASLPGVTGVDNQLATPAEVATENADTWIGRKINLALMFHSHVSASKTTVQVENGIVTLRGEANSAAQKELTAEYAKDIEGVKEVKNEMTVTATPEAAPQSAGEKMDDASITAQVKAALYTHHSTSTITTKVETLDGKVTLTGIAKNQAEKALVTKLVNDIQGVTSVNNEMTIGVPVASN